MTRPAIVASAKSFGAGIPPECPRAGQLILARVCTLGPGGVGQGSNAQTLTEDVLTGLSSNSPELNHSALRLLGSVLYRSGHFRAAIERINEGIAAENGETRVEDATMLAMAYHESGDPLSAGKMLSLLTSPRPPRPGRHFGPTRPLACSAARPNSSSSIAPSRSIHSPIEGSRRNPPTFSPPPGRVFVWSIESTPGRGFPSHQHEMRFDTSPGCPCHPRATTGRGVAHVRERGFIATRLTLADCNGPQETPFGDSLQSPARFVVCGIGNSGVLFTFVRPPSLACPEALVGRQRGLPGWSISELNRQGRQDRPENP